MLQCFRCSSERALERVRQRDGEDIKYEEKNELVFNQVRQNFLDVLPKMLYLLIQL